MESIKPPKKLRYLLSLECALIISWLVIVFNLITVDTAESPTQYSSNDEIFIDKILLIVLIGIPLLLSIVTVLSIKEYKDYVARRAYILDGKSNLSLSEILENENRLKILMEILENPGIHQNELLRTCALQKGQLQWHLAILLKNSIIKKEKYGQYTIYFPITFSADSIKNYKKLPKKAETTENVLDIIQKNPGINSSKISQILNLSRNTIKYHIDKLSENNLISSKEKGRKIELYPNL